MRALRVADPYRPHPRPWVWCRRNPRRVFVAALIVVTVVLIGVCL